jgi:hypothetical protein
LTKKRLQPGLPVSAAAHAGLLLATLLAFADARKFEDAQEAVPIDIVTDSLVNEVMKGEKTAKEVKPVQRADKQAPTSETKPLPPLAEAKKDIAAPPPQLRRRQDEPEDKPEAPPPPKRVAALPPTPEPPIRPAPPKPEPPKPIERAKPEPPEPPKPEPPPKPEARKPEPPKPQAKAAPTPPEREPEEAEVVRPKPPQRPPEKVEAAEPEKPAKQVEREPPKQEPSKPEPPKQAERPKAKDEPRLKVDEVAKLLERNKLSDRKKSAERAAAGDGPQDSKSDKPAAKPRSGDETAPKSKFDAANIANLLSREAPQRRAATGQEMTRTASLGAPTASAPRMSPTMEARINDYLIENYRRCWQAALVKNARAYVPLVEFRLTRNGALEGAPRLLNPSSDPVERSRGEQALAAIRRCSPMTVPEFFAPYYDHWHVTTFNMTDDM